MRKPKDKKLHFVIRLFFMMKANGLEIFKIRGIIFMKEYYFVKDEQIRKREGEQIMIIMDIKVDNLYAFKNFHMNMSYPKKIVGSQLEEHLAGVPSFRYKKIVIFRFFDYIIEAGFVHKHELIRFFAENIRKH